MRRVHRTTIWINELHTTHGIQSYFQFSTFISNILEALDLSIVPLGFCKSCIHFTHATYYSTANYSTTKRRFILRDHFHPCSRSAPKGGKTTEQVALELMKDRGRTILNNKHAHANLLSNFFSFGDVSFIQRFVLFTLSSPHTLNELSKNGMQKNLSQNEVLSPLWPPGVLFSAASAPISAQSWPEGPSRSIRTGATAYGGTLYDGGRPLSVKW